MQSSVFCLLVYSWHICPHKAILTTKYFSICSFLLFTFTPRDTWMLIKAMPTPLLPSLQIRFHAGTVRRGQSLWFGEGSHPVMDPSQTILWGITLSFPILYWPSHYHWENTTLILTSLLHITGWFWGFFFASIRTSRFGPMCII